MRCSVIVCVAWLFSACASVQYVPLKCNVTPPIKPNCSDYSEIFDCLKAKAKYLSDLELTLRKCL